MFGKSKSLFTLCIVVAFTVSFFTIPVRSACELGFKCLTTYQNIKFDVLIGLAAEASKPSEFVQWDDNTMKNWLSRLRGVCADYNTGNNCAGGRWWQCSTDAYLEGLLELMIEMGGDAMKGPSMPSTPEGLKGMLENVADLCEPQLATDLENDHKCIRRAFNTGSNREFRRQIEAADEASSNRCRNYNCPSAKQYTNVFVHLVDNVCKKGQETIMNFLHPVLKLNLQTRTETYCEGDKYPKTVNIYKPAPTGGIVTSIMVVNASADQSLCSGSATTTQKAAAATTEKATTIKATTPPTTKITTTTPMTTKAITTLIYFGGPAVRTTRRRPTVRTTRRRPRPQQRRTTPARPIAHRRPFAYSPMQNALFEHGLWFIEINKVSKTRNQGLYLKVEFFSLTNNLIYIIFFHYWLFR